MEVDLTASAQFHGLAESTTVEKLQNHDYVIRIKIQNKGKPRIVRSLRDIGDGTTCRSW